MELLTGDSGIGVTLVLRSENQADTCQLRVLIQTLTDLGAMLPEVDPKLVVGDQERQQLFLILPKKPKPESVVEPNDVPELLEGL